LTKHGYCGQRKLDELTHVTQYLGSKIQDLNRPEHLKHKYRRKKPIESQSSDTAQVSVKIVSSTNIIKFCSCILNHQNFYLVTSVNIKIKLILTKNYIKKKLPQLDIKSLENKPKTKKSSKKKKKEKRKERKGSFIILQVPKKFFYSRAYTFIFSC
jgi:hypothetical protein